MAVGWQRAALPDRVSRAALQDSAKAKIGGPGEDPIPCCQVVSVNMSNIPNKNL